MNPWQADRASTTPNQGSRDGVPVTHVILHATADRGNEAGTLSWWKKKEAQSSAHLLIHRDGSTTRVVEDDRRAWHAGRSFWPGMQDVNDGSLGWELANRNDGREVYTDAQYQTVANLLRHYLPQGIPRQNVLSHAQVAPGRKNDPLGWDWDRMWAKMGEGPGCNPVTPVSYPILRQGDEGEAVEVLQDLLGMPESAPDRFGPQTLAAVRGFQRMAGLQVDGVVGPSTWEALLRR